MEEILVSNSCEIKMNQEWIEMRNLFQDRLMNQYGSLRSGNNLKDEAGNSSEDGC